LIGGLLLIFAGLNDYLRRVSPEYEFYSGPVFLIVVGIVIIVVVAYALMMAAKRSPKPP